MESLRFCKLLSPSETYDMSRAPSPAANPAGERFGGMTNEAELPRDEIEFLRSARDQPEFRLKQSQSTQ
jgi:hypothetical protein